MINWREIIFGLLVGLLAVAILLLVVSSPKGAPIQLLPPPTPQPIMVDISGAVNRPGVYVLPAESRIKDAIEVAGGLDDTADRDLVNLAAPISDGQKVLIPEKGLNQSKSSVVQTPSNPNSLSETLEKPLININTATKEQLDQLPGIGAEKAQAIIDFRTRNGPFKSIDNIQVVPGIGPAIFEQIKSLITIE